MTRRKKYPSNKKVPLNDFFVCIKARIYVYIWVSFFRPFSFDGLPNIMLWQKAEIIVWLGAQWDSNMKNPAHIQRERGRERAPSFYKFFSISPSFMCRDHEGRPRLGLMKWSVARLFANFSRIFVQRLTSSEKLEHNSLKADRLIWK